METRLDDAWERNDDSRAIVKIIGRCCDTSGNWQLLVERVGGAGRRDRWWILEESLVKKYRQVVGSESAVT